MNGDNEGFLCELKFLFKCKATDLDFFCLYTLCAINSLRILKREIFFLFFYWELAFMWVNYRKPIDNGYRACS